VAVAIAVVGSVNVGIGVVTHDAYSLALGVLCWVAVMARALRAVTPTANQETELTDFERLDIGELLAFHRGWVDGQHQAWPRAYETMSPEHQVMYETGRLAVLNVMKTGPVPVWRGDRHTALGPVERALFRSIDETGEPWP
jgi:hypothetical protein